MGRRFSLKHVLLKVTASSALMIFFRIFSFSLIVVLFSSVRVLDEWESVPLYTRELLRFDTVDGAVREAFVYTQPRSEGRPASGPTPKKRSEVLADIEDFVEEMRLRGFYK